MTINKRTVKNPGGTDYDVNVSTADMGAGSADNQITELSNGGTLVGVTNPLTIGPAKVSGVNTAISQACTTSSTQILGSNTSRRMVMLTNTDTTYDCWVKYGTTASSTSFSVRIAAGQYWEMPQPIYTGVIEVRWSGSGSGYLVGAEL